MSPTPRYESVRVSRVLGVGQATALGISVSAFVAVFVLPVETIEKLGGLAQLPFVLAIVLCAPFVIASSRLAQGLRGDAGFYELARARMGLAPTFAVGWMVVGGYLALAALTVDALISAVQRITLATLAVESNTAQVMAVILLMAALNELAGGERWWSARARLVVWTLIILTALLVAAFAISRTLAHPTPQPNDLGRAMSSVGLFAAGLWGLDLILGHRSLFLRPKRTTERALALVVVVPSVMGALAAFSIGTLVATNDSSITEKFPEHRIIVFMSILGVVIGGAALFRVTSYLLRLLRELSADEFLPGWIAARDDDRSTAIATVTWLGAVGLLAHVEPAEALLGHAGLALLVVSLLIFGPQTQSGSLLARRLPLHPLVPGLVVALSLYFIAFLPARITLVGLGWAVVGTLAYATVGRRASEAKQRELSVVEADDQTDDRNRVLVAVGHEDTSRPLVRAALALGKQTGLEVCVLRVTQLPERLPTPAVRKAAQRDLRALEGLIDAENELEAEAFPMVRIAPDVPSGVLAATREQNAAVVLLGWRPQLDRPEDEEVLGRVFPAISRRLAVVRDAANLDRFDRVLVATAGGPHAGTALQVGHHLAASAGGRATLFHVDTPMAERDPEEVIASTLEAAELESSAVEVEVVKSTDIVESIRVASKKTDLVVLGASTDPLFNVNVLDGLAAEIPNRVATPAVVVKREEPAQVFFKRRFWGFLSRAFPTLTVTERAEVFSEMRKSARASVDFYVLISISTAIASLGLMLNSAAVIIGAMLVAPLMSPILATAFGMVKGNLLMIRRAASSTAKGTAVAVSIGTLFGLVFPLRRATHEMLARGEPNLLDLLVALAAGAAGAYSVSRKSVSAALPGVAIAVALVPPLGVVGLGLGSSRFGLAGGAMLLFLTNLAGILLIGALFFLLLGFRPRRMAKGGNVRQAILWTIAAIALVSIPLGLQTRSSLRAERLEVEIQRRLHQVDPSRLRVVDHVVRDTPDGVQVDVTVVAFSDQSANEERWRIGAEELRENLQEGVSTPITVRLTFVQGHTFEATYPPEIEADALGTPDAHHP